MAICASSSSSSTIELLLSPSPTSSSFTNTAAAATGGGKLVCFHPGQGWEEKGIDLGAIGWALGLDPSSVRLNGYLLGARGPDHVAASVTWRSLLAFFSARGLPTGRGGCGGYGALVAGDPAKDAPIVVQGRAASPASLPSGQKFSGSCFHYNHISRCHQEGSGRTNLKRKLAFHHERPLGKEELDQCDSSGLEDGKDGVGDSVLCIEKAPRLDDESPLEKKRKMIERDSGPTKLCTCNPPAGLTSNCVVGRRKRYREDDCSGPFAAM